jgi:hypothetical protein
LAARPGALTLLQRSTHVQSATDGAQHPAKESDGDYESIHGKLKLSFPWSIRALSPALAVKFNISPGRWQHFPLWLLFLQKDKRKRTKITGTQHVGK